MIIISIAIRMWKGPSGKPAYIADARWPVIDANPTKTGGKKDAASSAGTVSSASEPMPDGILMNPPTAQSAANNAVSVIILSFITYPLFYPSGTLSRCGHIHYPERQDAHSRCVPRRKDRPTA